MWDGYDGYYPLTDGYNRLDKQINIKLSKEDFQAIEEINQHFFENEITTSNLGRILIRKGIQFFKTRY